MVFSIWNQMIKFPLCLEVDLETEIYSNQIIQMVPFVIGDRYPEIIKDVPHHKQGQYTDFQKDMAYAIQKETEDENDQTHPKAHDLTGEKNIVISGGYGLNCVANYKFKKAFPDFNFFVEPISHDGGTSIGGAYHVYLNKDKKTYPQLPDITPTDSLYYGPLYDPDEYLNEIDLETDQYEVTDTSYDDVAKLIREGNIVTIFQGRSEGGPAHLVIDLFFLILLSKMVRTL